MPADSYKRMESTGSNSKNGASDDASNSSPSTSNLQIENDGSNRNMRFVLPSIAGSPPKIVSMDEIVNLHNNIQKMEIIHEIALNPDFKLQPHEPPENSLQKRIKETMHKAFWDNLREQINGDPPCFDHAIQLLDDIKEYLSEIVTAKNQRMLEHINEVLDATIIKQQAEQGVLNFRSYADFVIQIMAKLCAPVRDEQIKKLGEIEDVVETFKGILETMQLMKLDVTNWLLEFAKKDLLINSVKYEKQKFKEYLEYYNFGFPATESWLKRNQTENDNGVKSSTDETIFNAYMELLNWDETNEFPEMLNIDKERLLKFGNRALRLCIGASTMAVCSSLSVISQRSENRQSLAKQIEILLQVVTNKKDLKETLENVWIQVRTFINGRLEDENQNQLENETENVLKGQILQLENDDSPIRKLMYDRLKVYIRLILRTKTGLPAPPPGYTDFKEELENLATAFRSVINYNYAVFGEYYVKLLSGQSLTTSE